MEIKTKCPHCDHEFTAFTEVKIEISGSGGPDGAIYTPTNKGPVYVTATLPEDDLTPLRKQLGITPES